MFKSLLRGDGSQQSSLEMESMRSLLDSSMDRDRPSEHTVQASAGSVDVVRKKPTALFLLRVFSFLYASGATESAGPGLRSPGHVTFS